MSHPSSYRDPSGFIFLKDGIVFRQVNLSFRDDFEKFIQSGCYDHFIKEGLLIRHTRLDQNLNNDKAWYTTLQPEQVNFLSYPYEWSFNMIKDAALLTLRLAREALPFGLVLKDASPYNIQWHQGRLVFIDSLSFERYDETRPWIAYRQFCECFLAPLLISHYSRQPLGQLMVAYPDGIPLTMASSLLPRRTRFSLHTYLHIHLHAKTKTDKQNKVNRKFSRKKMENILTSLEILVRKCELPQARTAWSGYYEEASERSDYLEQKKQIINAWVDKISFNSAADLGANTGIFTEIVSHKAGSSLAIDADPYCIDDIYLRQKKSKDAKLQPLVIDLSTPSPAIGFNNRERDSFNERIAGTELIMALALIHHLAIGKNIPLRMLASFFANITGKYLFIEFIPKSDEKVQLLLSGRKDIFSGYDQEQFETEFLKYFRHREKQEIASSGRTLYLFEK